MRVRFGFPGRAGAGLGSDFPASPCPLCRRESRIRHRFGIPIFGPIVHHPIP